MIVKNNLVNLELGEIRIFNYSLLEQELGVFERYKQYDGWECEEVIQTEEVDEVLIEEHGWQIIGTNNIIEFQWTEPKDVQLSLF